MKYNSKIVGFSTVLFGAVASGGLIHTQIMYHGCGLTGSPAPPIAQQLNYLKNRFSSPKAKDIKPGIILNAVLATGGHYPMV